MGLARESVDGSVSVAEVLEESRGPLQDTEQVQSGTLAILVQSLRHSCDPVCGEEREGQGVSDEPLDFIENHYP